MCAVVAIWSMHPTLTLSTNGMSIASYLNARTTDFIPKTLSLTKGTGKWNIYMYSCQNVSSHDSESKSKLAMLSNNAPFAFVGCSCACICACCGDCCACGRVGCCMHSECALPMVAGQVKLPTTVSAVPAHRPFSAWELLSSPLPTSGGVPVPLSTDDNPPLAG